MAYGDFWVRGPFAAVATGLYTTTAATWDLSRVFDVRHSSRQRRILNPLSEPRDGTHNLMLTSWI